MCVTVGFTEEREAFYILARQIFRKVILLDESRLFSRWPKSAAVLCKMFTGADKLIKNCEEGKAKFSESKILENKA